VHVLAKAIGEPGREACTSSVNPTRRSAWIEIPDWVPLRVVVRCRGCGSLLACIVARSGTYCVSLLGIAALAAVKDR
jgi:hypothetical protein